MALEEDLITLSWVCPPELKGAQIDILRQINHGDPVVLAKVPASTESFKDISQPDEGFVAYLIAIQYGTEVQILNPGTGIRR